MVRPVSAMEQVPTAFQSHASFNYLKFKGETERFRRIRRVLALVYAHSVYGRRGRGRACYLSLCAVHLPSCRMNRGSRMRSICVAAVVSSLGPLRSSLACLHRTCRAFLTPPQHCRGLVRQCLKSKARPEAREQLRAAVKTFPQGQMQQTGDEEVQPKVQKESFRPIAKGLPLQTRVNTKISDCCLWCRFLLGLSFGPANVFHLLSRAKS